MDKELREKSENTLAHCLAHGLVSEAVQAALILAILDVADAHDAAHEHSKASS